jgi:putative colanic acid biosysnthesis UDP-glucose lipid carrier transferase
MAASTPPLLALLDAAPRLLPIQPGVASLLRRSLDAALAIGALFASVLWFGGRFEGPYLILALLVFSLTFPGSLSAAGMDPAALARKIAAGWLATTGLLLLIGWATGTLGVFDQRVLAAWFVFTPAALYGAHRASACLLPRVLAAEGVQKTAVIAGANELGRRLAARIDADPFLGVRVTGYFDDRRGERLEQVEPRANFGPLRDLATYVKAHRIDLIYITLPMASQPRILALLEDLRDTTASIYFAPDILLFDLIQAHVENIGGIPLVAVCESPFYGVDGAVKRASDLLLATAILMLILPLMCVIAAGIKLGSPGPVLFRQRRYGLDGREIVVYKFRTMTVLEDGAVIRQATRGDSRVTPFGAFLRKYSLDELPQFINVLQGRMSVVGPRPHAVAHNEIYRKLIRGYMIRHKVRPGITGLAQVCGLRGETESVEKMQARVECDLAYLRNWSLLLDLRIVLRTVGVVLDPQNAY